jgi:uncharacterized protein involved in outer membrane biogenesis
MRKLGIAVGVLLVLIIAVLVIAPKMINVNKYHDQIQSQLSEKLGRPVTLGEMSLSLLPPKFTVQNASIFEDSHFGSGTFAQMQSMAVRVKFLPLLSKNVEVQSLTLEHPQVELIRDEQGVWNFSSLGKPNGAPATTGNAKQPSAPAKPSPTQPTSSEPKSSAGNFELSELNLNDGTVAITDKQKHQPRAVYDHIDLTLKDFAENQPFTVTLAAHLPGNGKQVAKLDGKVGPINNANTVMTPFDGTLQLDQVSVSGAQKFLNLAALENTDAVITGKADIKNVGGKLNSKGAWKIEDAKVHGTDIGYPVSLDYDASDDLANDVIQISNANLKLGSTPVDINGTVNTKSTPSLADLKIKANDVSISEMARLAGAFGVAFNPGMQIAGRVNADIHAQGNLSSPSLNGSLTARDLQMSGKDVPAPVKVPSIALQLTPQQITSNQFTASSGNTSVNARFAMSQYTTKSPSVDATVKMDNANVADVLSIAKAAGIEAAEGMSGSGTVWLNLHAVGPIKNTAAMQLSGTGSVQNTSLKAPQLTQPLVLHAAALKFTQNTMSVDGLNLTLGSTNATGNLSMKNFQAPQVQFNLSADKVNVNEIQKIMGTESAPAKVSSLNLIPRAEAAPAKTMEPSLLSKTTGAGTVSIGNIIYDDLQMQNTKSNVTLNNGIIKMDPVNTTLYGGSATGNITVDTRGQTTLYNIALKTQKVDSNKLLSSVSSAKDVLYGLLASNIQSSFASAANANIARSLNGHVAMNVTNGKLANVDILQQLSAVGKFSQLNRTAQNFTNLQQMGGDFDIRNGVATTNNLKALIEGGTLAATGAINLVDQTVNMHMTAVLSKSYSQQVGGNQIGGYMNTALANNNGELVLPVLLTGTLGNVHFAPDVEAIAQMKLHNLLPSFNNPGQLTNGVLGAIGGKKGSGQSGIGGVLDAISGKPKDNQQYQNQQQPPATQNSGNTQQPSQQQQGQDLVNGIVGMFGKKKPANPPPAPAKPK